MKRLLVVIALGASLAWADQQDFCDGFAEGYLSIMGSIAVVPVCPVWPVAPAGSTDFREGLKAGMRAARERQ